MKIVYISPHLSTGGCPQFLLKKIQVLHSDHEIHCIEYNDHGRFTVQKNQIKEILGNRLYRVNDRKEELIEIIEKVQPDVVHMEEMPEYFMDKNIAAKLYKKDRAYKLIETSHDSSFDPSNKIYFPDRFIFVSKFQEQNMKVLGIPSEVCEYPIIVIPRKPREQAIKTLNQDISKKHVVHVGLFTPRKNQAEIIEYARSLLNYPIHFHFIGNQADNFKFYWEPLMKNFPKNCTWWNERKDVDNFYQMADLFLFPSKDGIGDKETSPLVIREAISYNIPSLIYNSPVYMGMYDKFDNIEYLDENNQNNNCNKILKMLNINTSATITTTFDVRYDKTCNKVLFKSKSPINDLLVSVKELDSKTVLWAVKYPHMPANAEWWIIPTPKHVMDYETHPVFGGLLVEFYQNDTLVYSTDFRIKPAIPNKHQSILKNNTEPMYMNYMEFFVEKIYDKYLHGKNFNTVVDVGANIGLWTEYIKNTAKCGTVYSIEPNKSALKILKNTFDTGVVVVEKAMSNKDGQLEFFVDKNNSTVSSVAKVNSADISYKVDCISFQSFISQYNIKKIDLLKVDIETGEYDLFGSMSESDLGMIENVLMEYHLMGGRTYDNDVSKIINQLKNVGFSVTIKNLHPHGGFIFATKENIKVDSRNLEMISILDSNKCPDKRDLATLANKLFPNGTGVEIGVLRGEYSKLILERWKNCQLYLVDTWRHLDNYVDMNGQDDKYHYECLLKTCENTKPWQNRAHIIRMDSAISANIFPDEHFDFVYIDADHSYEGVMRDIKAWWPKVKKGGLFCGDDYIPDDGDIWMTVTGKPPVYAGKFGVRKAVTEFSATADVTIYHTTTEPYWRQWYTFKPF